MYILRTIIISLCLSSLLTPCRVLARGNFDPEPRQTSSQAGTPAYGVAVHDIGKIALTVCNNGTFGDGFATGGTDIFTDGEIPSCEYPKGSNSRYLFAGAVWIGAVVGRDTLVSAGADGWSSDAEFTPDVDPLGRMQFRSISDPSSPDFEGAVSEQDYIAVYYDTCLGCMSGTDYLDGRGHRPIGLKVVQRSFSWSYEYAEDFVLFDFAIENIGQQRLRDVYMGIYVDADIHQAATPGGAQDDLCGFRRTFPAQYLAPHFGEIVDTVNVAWTVDNDGDFGTGGEGEATVPVPHVTATRIVRAPAEDLQVSFNWWISNGAAARDYGPQARATYRELATGGSGTPEGDRNKYHFLSNGEFDFDQVMTASIPFDDTVWIPPPIDQVRLWSTGLDTRYLLSFGPFSVDPGQMLPISLAYVAGEDFHQSADNFNNLPDNWQAYYAGVSFDDLALNATWADWIYDNPGVDTDGDGYDGEYHYAISPETGDTVDSRAYRGDGVPDWKGAGPPPAPEVRIEPSVGLIRILFNGYRSENSLDVFSDTVDFEGYRIYCSRDERLSSYSLLASYDIEDYDKHVWYQDTLRDTSYFRLLDFPFTIERLRELYSEGDPDWSPDNYARNYPLVMDEFPDSIFYFEPHDFNRHVLQTDDSLFWSSPIRKIYKDAPKPPNEWWFNDRQTLVLPDSITDQGLDTAYLTADGYWKYYEYEYAIENLLPTVSYWVNVTAFDFGSPQSGLPSLETNPTVEPRVSYPLESAAEVAAHDLKVFVYPNPYLLDANYRENGFEGRGEDRPTDRTRLLHFANLPTRCTIRIYSLDGDMIREMEHFSGADSYGSQASHETWDLITRNAQLVVSGLYYWTVEDENGRTQIGKLAIIL
ncbi:MAG: hypothetical protein DRP45_05910 [Candidatus Zixiibacteriota bacterium]|nr:MAG: hypothetical protein DRP45_05910 [candidate division Zixibacteria bacterium]